MEIKVLINRKILLSKAIMILFVIIHRLFQVNLNLNLKESEECSLDFSNLKWLMIYIPTPVLRKKMRYIVNLALRSIRVSFYFFIYFK